MISPTKFFSDLCQRDVEFLGASSTWQFVLARRLARDDLRLTRRSAVRLKDFATSGYDAAG